MINKQLVLLIERLTELVSSFEEQYIHDSTSAEITASQLRYLEAITSLANPTVSEIADVLGVKLPSVTMALKTLLERNLIQKVQDSNDKRVVKVLLTKDGKRIANLHRKAHEALAQSIEKNLEKREVEVLMDLLMKIFNTEDEI